MLLLIIVRRAVGVNTCNVGIDDTEHGKYLS